LSGSFEQIRQVANNFNISYVVTKSQKAYTVEHTSDIFLIGPDGKILQVFALNASAKEIAAAMRPLAD
jgi:cytochrome oxidase Cu insertion factor (SCO1/SenC/PrrC family)